METVYDWVTVGLFGLLVILFLQRSVEEEPRDSILHYLPPALGLAVANYVGNQGFAIISTLIVVAVLAYILLILKPFDRLSS